MEDGAGAKRFGAKRVLADSLRTRAKGEFTTLSNSRKAAATAVEKR